MKVALFEFNYKNANLTGVLVVLDRKINLYLESTWKRTQERYCSNFIATSEKVNNEQLEKDREAIYSQN